MRSCVAFRCKKYEGFELLGSWQGVSCSEIHDGDINVFSGYSITFGQAAALFSIRQSRWAQERKDFLLLCLHYSEAQMSSAQMSPALFSKVEASGLGESSGGETCMVGLQVLSGHYLSLFRLAKCKLATQTHSLEYTGLRCVILNSF